MSRMGQMNYAQTQCVKSAGKLAQQAGMLTPGARVGLAVSGGLDSFTMLKVMQLRQRILPFPIELMVLHVNPGFDPENHAPLADYVAREGLAAHLAVTDHGPRAHSEENRKNSACFLCARWRRTRLFSLCKRYKLTHLAFGHTADDLAATFLMNLYTAGRVGAMSIKEPFFRGELTVIRPMAWLQKQVLTRAAKAWELPVFGNPCPSAGKTNRAEMEAHLAELKRTAPRRYANVIQAVTRFQTGKAREVFDVPRSV